MKKNRSELIYKAFIILIILASMLIIWNISGFEKSPDDETIAGLIETAEYMNIKNLVTTVYLGPRIFDTFLEVMVVILTVFGVKKLRSED